ncbi:MAG: hypothetical protein L0Z53_21065, partial [Acidobacteriales bacterium]|nr:hypothetical protein [Terriglobales bacterium]
MEAAAIADEIALVFREQKQERWRLLRESEIKPLHDACLSLGEKIKQAESEIRHAAERTKADSLHRLGELEVMKEQYTNLTLKIIKETVDQGIPRMTAADIINQATPPSTPVFP